MTQLMIGAIFETLKVIRDKFKNNISCCIMQPVIDFHFYLPANTSENSNLLEKKKIN